ncbi:hypothetical protein Anas_14324 [Armadillidium nasatum]|uniref:Uncharacterized protein n=1 Tax=Armadillidium nasatum TaxID=96803 RepID=A0A5N5T3H9_9CRUS|nr:hypothetical protein Anas_14324 [Armadillidium nasatum]
MNIQIFNMKNLIQAIFLLTIISFSFGQEDYDYGYIPYCTDLDSQYLCPYVEFWNCIDCHIPCYHEYYDDYEDYGDYEDYYDRYYRGCENCCLNNNGQIVSYVRCNFFDRCYHCHPDRYCPMCNEYYY